MLYDIFCIDMSALQYIYIYIYISVLLCICYININMCVCMYFKETYIYIYIYIYMLFFNIVFDMYVTFDIFGLIYLYLHII